ncbi:hypothetical protein BJY04DRAFT_194991 [Aspergillus karnatakaensis]|uniref:retropepsin-like aspartic protease n=1 Tax=Aspergillus karnatakaensis TaxID=1810916 RepID=UPI003CCE41E1
MPFFRSFKNIAWNCVPCCGHRNNQLDYKHSGEDDVEYPHTLTSVRAHKARSVTQRDTHQTRENWGTYNRISSIPASTSTTGEDEVVDSRLKIQGQAEIIQDRIFFYDIVVYGLSAEKVIYRRTLLDFDLEINAISDEIPRALNLPIEPYRGSGMVKLPSGKSVQPVGTLVLRWQLYNDDNLHTTHFLVIKNSHFDMLLGRSSIEEYKLWEWDREIQARLY